MATRSYDMTRRAQLAAETSERIVDATEALLAEGPLAGVTLGAIAGRAGVTTQTVLRHMGSRDGCLEAVGRRLTARVEEQRGSTTPGDVPGAVQDLVAHYEAEGRLVLNLLTAADAVDPFAERAAEAGRAYHRAWVERCFAPALARCDADASERLDALVAATDLYVWKLLRLDLGRSRASTEAVVRRLVRAVLEEACAES
jgi:AcrR family transcriptional regulator